MSRTWRFNTMAADETPITEDITDAEILATYGPDWREAMERVGKAALISDENCIQDFVVVHWAWEVPSV
jgi:hypothetical protein